MFMEGFSAGTRQVVQQCALHPVDVVINANGNGLNGQRDSQKDTGIEGRVQQGCFNSGGSETVSCFFKVFGQAFHGGSLIVDCAVVKNFEVREGGGVAVVDGFCCCGSIKFIFSRYLEKSCIV